MTANIRCLHVTPDYFKNLIALCILLAAINFSADRLSAQSLSQPLIDPAQRAHVASAALLALYNRDTGLFDGAGWWNSANAITTLADQAATASTGDFDPIFINTLTQAQTRFQGFLNEFYDDEGWWALAWIDVFERDGNKLQLQMAQSIFLDMTGGWDSTCNGGIWWKKDRHYKNAIANELFLSVAAKLALHSKGKARREYLQWAEREWQWFSTSGMIRSDGSAADGTINDGLDQSCHNNGRTVWSYNQGVILGGLSNLSLATKDPKLLLPAHRIATAAISYLADSQKILHDHCEPKCGVDGVQFKGIFIRNLGQLQRVSPDPLYAVFIRDNADAVWNLSRTPYNHFSQVWTGPPQDDGATALSSALDVLVAASALSKTQP